MKRVKQGANVKLSGLLRVKSRGSAIIIAFFLMAAIGGIAFAIGRIFILDTSISSLYENGTVAYYAAESGIEEGMLRYRYNMNYQVPDGTSNVRRYNLSNARLNKLSTDPVATLIPNSEKKFYDLNAIYKAKFYGDTDREDGSFNLQFFESDQYGKNGDAKVFRIPRDESIKIDISNFVGSGSNDMDMYLKMDNFDGQDNGNSDPADKTLIEVKVTGTFGSEQTKTFLERKKALVTPTTAIPIADTTSRVMLAPMLSPVCRYCYSKANIISSVAESSLAVSNKAELSIKPVGSDIYIALIPRNSRKMASPWTTVKSTGYFGNAARTLTANIDRQSGTVYDLFDFVVYKHN
ncbi:MAG: pilus assembly PilX N-terminal domain-containing protein [Patescibacteria group bacterium]